MALNINWFPGHMKKTKEEIERNLKLVDIVCEIIDARIPESSRNPMLDEILAGKPRMVLMNKADLADSRENQRWINYFKNQGIEALAINSKENINVGKIYETAKAILKDKFDRNEKKDIQNKKIKMMIVGIPNSGKSTFINNVSKRKGAKVGNRPGVTQTKQWIRTKADIDLLDTPGVLWPKFDDKTGLHLAFTGAIRDEVVNIDDLALYFLEEMIEKYPENLKERYNIELSDRALDVYEAIAKRRGAIMAGGDFDYTRTAGIILNDFRAGKLGNISLESL